MWSLVTLVEKQSRLVKQTTAAEKSTDVWTRKKRSNVTTALIDFRWKDTVFDSMMPIFATGLSFELKHIDLSLSRLNASMKTHLPACENLLWGIQCLQEIDRKRERQNERARERESESKREYVCKLIRAKFELGHLYPQVQGCSNLLNYIIYCLLVPVQLDSNNINLVGANSKALGKNVAQFATVDNSARDTLFG